MIMAYTKLYIKLFQFDIIWGGAVYIFRGLQHFKSYLNLNKNTESKHKTKDGIAKCHRNMSVEEKERIKK